MLYNLTCTFDSVGLKIGSKECNMSMMGKGLEFEKHRENDLRAVWQAILPFSHQQLLSLSLLYSDSFLKQTKCLNSPSRHCWEKWAECLGDCITKQFSPYSCSCSHTLTKVKQGMCVKAPGALQRETDQPPWPCILFPSFTGRHRT